MKFISLVTAGAVWGKVWPILIAILFFGLIVFFHELGHFTFAKLFKVKVNEFALGMGPQIFSRVSKKSGIRYSIRLFLIGGYVSMDGEDGDSENPNAFCNKNVWQRILIIVAGAGMNILLGFIAMFILTTSTVAGTEGALLPTNVIAEFNQGATSNMQGENGLMVGDRVMTVGGFPVFTGYTRSPTAGTSRSTWVLSEMASLSSSQVYSFPPLKKKVLFLVLMISKCTEKPPISSTSVSIR